MDIRETIHDLIDKNEIDDAIETLKTFLKDKNPDLYREALNISRRFTELETKKRRWLIDETKANEESLAISNAIFDLAENASGKKEFLGGEKGTGDPKNPINVDNAGIVGEDIKLSGEYVAGGNITINYYNKPEEKPEDKPPKDNNSNFDISELEKQGFQEEATILMEKLSYLKSTFATMAEGSAKFQLKKEIEGLEGQIAELKKKLG
ncbi:MAG: hypothetical protein AAF502_05965 [Bacteroidota bacterium]